MDSNKELFTKIISIVSLVVLGYVFFISVYNQIIVQSGGLFYVIIFGGILILAFVLLSLVTKLIEITGEIKDNFMWNFVEILLLCNFAYLFFAFRLSYRSTIPAEETIIYRAAVLMRNGELADKGMDMFRHLIVYPSQYVYALVLSLFLRVSDDGSQTMIILNAIVLTLNAFVIDRVVRKIAGRACGVMAALCTLFIPSQSFAVYSYSGEAFFCLILLLAVDILLIVMRTEDHDSNKVLIYSALLGAVTALLCFTEPLMLICVILFAVYFILRKRENGESPAKPVFVITGVAVILFILLIFVKSLALNSDLGSVVSGSMSRFKLTRNIETDEKYSFKEIFTQFHENLDNQDANVSDNYHFLVNDEGEEYTRTNSAWFSLGTQMSYMFVIVMSIACSFYTFKSKSREAIPAFLLLIGCFIVLFFRSTDESSTYFMFEILIIMAGCGLYLMYMNHHPELRTDLGTQMSGMEANTIADRDVSEWGAIARARALIFAGKDASVNQVPGAPVQASGTGQTVNIGAGVQTAAQDASRSTVGEAMVSPEGYFSFFAMPPQTAAASTVPQEPVKAVPLSAAPAGEVPADEVSAYEEPSYEESVNEYIEPAEEYAEPAAEYAEPAAEYAEPVAEYAESEGEYEEPAAEYAEPAGEYQEPSYEESVTGYEQTAEEYEEPVYEEPEYIEPTEEYAEPAAEYAEPAGEYQEPSYEESVAGYEQIAEEYAEPVYEETEYIEPAGEYNEPVTEYAEAEYEEPGTEYTGQAEEYAEPVYEEPEYVEPAAEYSEPATEYTKPVYKKPSAYDQGGTRASYGNAAHALGFSLGEDFFADMNNYVQTEEPEYEEQMQEPVYISPESGAQTAVKPEYESEEDEGFDIFGNEIPYEETIQQTPADDAHKPYYASEDEEVIVPQVPAYEFAGNYDSDVDEFSFGESMPVMPSPDDTAPNEPQRNEAANSVSMTASTEPEPVRKKKVVKKIVRRVVKKAPVPEQNQVPDQVTLQANFLRNDALRDIAADFGGSGDDDLYYEGYNSGMPDLVQENLMHLAQANIPVSNEEPNISDIILDEADSRYNLDGFGDEDWDEGPDDGSNSGYVIEI